MALVVFLRGINVGGHRRFRPSVLAKELKGFDVVSIGAAGTFVARKPGSPAKFRAALARRLPFDAEIMICEGREILRLTAVDRFAGRRTSPSIIQFVSVLAKRPALRPRLPAKIPSAGKWFVNVLACRGRFVLGVHRREMRAITCLGQLDKLFGVRATTRSWSTIVSIGRILRGE